MKTVKEEVNKLVNQFFTNYPNGHINDFIKALEEDLKNKSNRDKWYVDNVADKFFHWFSEDGTDHRWFKINGFDDQNGEVEGYYEVEYKIQTHENVKRFEIERDNFMTLKYIFHNPYEDSDWSWSNYTVEEISEEEFNKIEKTFEMIDKL